MQTEAQGLAGGLLVWWPLIGAVAGQLLALGMGVGIVLRLRSDFTEHDAKDDKRFEALHAKIDARVDGLNDRITDLRVDLGARHER